MPGEKQTIDDTVTGLTAPAVVRVRAGRTADKRRSWHVARLASDIQRSLADQSSTPNPRSSWHPNDDWSSSYHPGSGWATTAADSRASGQQVGQLAGYQRTSFTIASWVDRPNLQESTAKEMDAAIAHYTTTPDSVQHPQYQQPNGSSDDSQDDIVPSLVIVPVTLTKTEGAQEAEETDQQVAGHHKRIVSTLSDNYIDVVVRELRGATPCGFFFPNGLIPPSVNPKTDIHLFLLIFILFHSD